jgi:hypothetical protein
MNNKFKILVFLVFVSFSAVAQLELSPEQIYTQLSKSIVWVEVSNIPGKDNNVCTGFVWDKPNQIVTSLHAMNPSGKIWIKYYNSYRYLREATIKKYTKMPTWFCLRSRKVN